MRIALAKPFDGHPADAVVDLDDATARRLLSDGAARRPSVKDIARQRKPSPRSEAKPTPKPRGSGRRTRKEK